MYNNKNMDPLDANTILTEDGQRIAFNHLKKSFPQVIIIAHGFYNNKDTVLFKGIANSIHKYYDVITFDFRGHGKSSGLFTWTSHEQKDLQAVISYTKLHNYAKIGILGFSLGGAIALIEASRNTSLQSIISVSSPSDFWKINYHFWKEEMWEDLKLNLGVKGRGKGIRPGNPFTKKIRPVDVVHQISPRPILFIHGQKDWLIHPSHSQKLFEKAGERKAINIIQDGGHAERIFDVFSDRFEKICLDWFKETL